MPHKRTTDPREDIHAALQDLATYCDGGRERLSEHACDGLDDALAALARGEVDAVADRLFDAAHELEAAGIVTPGKIARAARLAAELHVQSTPATNAAPASADT